MDTITAVLIYTRFIKKKKVGSWRAPLSFYVTSTIPICDYNIILYFHGRKS